MLSVRVVGVGDAFTERHHNACLLFEASGERLLVDAPPALARALADLGERGGERVSIRDVDRVLVTHLHGDHCGGLEQLLYVRRFIAQEKAHVFAIREVLRDVWDTRLRGGMEQLMDASFTKHAMTLGDYAHVTDLGDADHAVTRIGPFTVEVRRTIHHVPTSALRVSAGGKTIAYSADTAFDPGLIAWLEAADVVLHETNFGVHTPLASLVGLPAATRDKMRLIHYPDSLEPGSAPIACALEGDRYEP